MTYEDLHDVVLLHGKSIYSFCRHLTENAADADDLYQETFLKAVELHWQIDAAQNPKGFLVAVAARLWRNRRRKYAWRPRFPDTHFRRHLAEQPAQGGRTQENPPLFLPF